MKKIFLLLLTVASLGQLTADSFSWSNPPTVISTSSVDASDARVVIDATGNATAAWIESATVMSSTQPLNGSWGTASTLSGSGASDPGLSVDSSGNVTAIWVEGGVVKSAYMTSGGSWGSATALSDTGASDPSICVDAAGNSVAVWVRNGYVETATLLAGGSWGSVSMLSNANSDNPSVAIGEDGTVVALWHTVSGGFDILVSSTMSIGNAWSSPVTAISNSVSHNYPVVAVDGSGNALAIWYSYVLSGGVYSNVKILSATLASGDTSWSSPFLLSVSSNYNPQNLMARLTFDSQGDALGVWTTVVSDNTFNIETAVKPFGRDWIQGGALVGNNTYGYEADISTTTAGDSTGVYMFYDGASLMIQSSTTDIAGTGYNYWSVPINVSTGTSNAYPKVGVSLSGTTINAVAVWIQNNGTNNVVNASVASKSVLLPPTSPTVVQSSNDLGVFIEYFNTLSWTASTDPAAIGYNIFRNGLYWTQVSADVLSVVDNNVQQNGAVTYGVATIDNALDQSVVATVNFP